MTEPQQSKIEFRVEMTGFALPQETRRAIEASIRRAVLLELAALDLGPDERLTVRPLGARAADDTSDLPLTDILIGLIIELAT